MKPEPVEGARRDLAFEGVGLRVGTKRVFRNWEHVGVANGSPRVPLDKKRKGAHYFGSVIISTSFRHFLSIVQLTVCVKLAEMPYCSHQKYYIS